MEHGLAVLSKVLGSVIILLSAVIVLRAAFRAASFRAERARLLRERQQRVQEEKDRQDYLALMEFAQPGNTFYLLGTEYLVLRVGKLPRPYLTAVYSDKQTGGPVKVSVSAHDLPALFAHQPRARRTGTPGEGLSNAKQE